MLMTSINIVIQNMREIASQASILATGLQNAAPPGASLLSVQYLVDITASLEKTSHEIEELSEAGSKELEAKLLSLMQAIVLDDQTLRKKNGMEDKFRFIRERLEALFQQVEQEVQVATKQGEQQTNKNELQEDETVIYVYLYNAHGALLSTWQNLLTPKVFYEYSVNRPIYTEKTHIEELVRSKNSKSQHAYLTIIIKKSHVIQAQTQVKDSLGNPMVRIKEGSLLFEKLVGFTFNEQEYILNDKHELIKKS